MHSGQSKAHHFSCAAPLRGGGVSAVHGDEKLVRGAPSECLPRTPTDSRIATDPNTQSQADSSGYTTDLRLPLWLAWCMQFVVCEVLNLVKKDKEG